MEENTLTQQHEDSTDIIESLIATMTGEDTSSTSENITTVLTGDEIEMLNQAIDEAHPSVSENIDIIPENSPTLLVSENTSRFSSALWYDKVQKHVITLAGIGGIGSHVGFLLSRLNPSNLYIYDDDVVEKSNLSGQFYSTEDFGKDKTYALARLLSKFSNYNSVYAYTEKYTINDPTTDIMICGFDNMSARRVFFNSWLKHVSHKLEEDRANCLYIDGRLAAEEFQVLCIKGDDNFNINRYEKEFLFSDSEADETICSYKQTSFCASMIASYMVNLYVNFCSNQCNPIINRDLPFLTEYNAETMYLKTES